MLQVSASVQWNSNYTTKSKTHVKLSAKNVREGLSHSKDYFDLEIQHSKLWPGFYLNIFTFPAWKEFAY